MSLNPNHVDYRSPSRGDRLNVRHHNEQCGEHITNALEKINLIGRAGDPSQHVDPLESVQQLNDISEKIFSEVPKDLVNIKGKKNQILIKARNSEKMASVSAERRRSSASPQRPSGQAITSVQKPLPLSWDARRTAKTLPKKKNTSVYAGLFSQNAELIEGVEQGPIPSNITNPDGESKRAIIARKQEARRRANIVVDRNRKAEVLKPKRQLKLKGNTVGQDFVPAVAAAATKGTRKQEIIEARETRQKKFLGTKAFK